MTATPSATPAAPLPLRRPLRGRWALLTLWAALFATAAHAQPAAPKPAAPKSGDAKPAAPKAGDAKPGDGKPKLIKAPRLLPRAPAPNDAGKPAAKPSTPGKPAKGDPDKKRPPVGVDAPTRWTDETPEKMAALNIARARAGGPDAVAGLLVAAALDDRAPRDEVLHELNVLGRSELAIADDARVLAQISAPQPLAPAWEGWAKQSFEVAPNKNGIVQAFSILGPFQDAGGGVAKHEGPEEEGHDFADASAEYSWGVYEVKWRRVLPVTVTAEGLPLDLYISPRQEACTYLASKITFVADASVPVVVRLAATGAVRLSWDGETVAESEDVHTKAILDRMAVKVPGEGGAHLLTVKVCSGSQPDEGRVRVRLTDEAGNPVTAAASSLLEGIPADRLSTKGSGPKTTAKPTKALTPPKGPTPAPPQPPKGVSPPAGPTKPAPMTPPATPMGGEDPGSPGGAPSGAAPGASPGNGQTVQLHKKVESTKPVAPPGGPVAAASPSPKTPAAAPKNPTSKAKTKSGPSKVARVKTALEQALDVGTSASRDAAIRAIVVRTLAGADDARSPRAPGLLDRVTRDPGVTPDELALAGWLSTFGANRSGWMNQAVERARAVHDPATEGFALRRIAQSQYGTGRLDWALSTMQADQFKSATDVEARAMRVELQQRIGGQGAQAKALETLQALDAEQKQRTPIFVVRDMRQLAASRPELARDLERRLAQIDRPSASYANTMGIDGAAATERAVAQVMVRQTDAEAISNMGRVLLSLGRDEWAREVFFTATKLSPNSTSAFDGLATAREAVIRDEAAAKKPPTDDARLANAAAQRALDLRPADPRAKAEMAFRAGALAAGQEDKKTASKESDEKYLVAPAQILDRAKKKPAKVGEVFDRQLHFMRIVTYHPDKRISQLIHYAREIVVEPRTDDELFERELPTEGDEAELLFARVYRKDGSIAQPEEQSSGGQPFVKWPQLKTGDVVEVAVRSWTAGPVGRRGDAPFYFIDYVGSTETRPVLFNEVIVDSPEGSSLGVDVINGKADRVEESKDGGRKVQRFIWENPPTIPDEPLALRTTEVLPIVVGSTYRSWDEFREWYRSAIQGFSEPDDQIRELAKKLTKDKKTEKQKLEAIFNFVADDIRYVNYVSGEWWLPNRPQQLLARRQGDCDDKATLLISLLKAINVEATPVLVQTRLTGMPNVLSSQKAAIPMFDHGIAFLPGKNGQPGQWLDATSPQSRLGPLPSMDARARAMFVYQGEAKIIETPQSSPDDNGSSVDWTVKLSPTGAADIVAKEKHIGDWAFELRNNLVEPDARAQWLEQYLTSRWLSAVDLNGDIQYSADAGTLGYSVHAEGFARREGDELSIPLAGTFSYTSALAPLTRRTQPVSLPPNLAPSRQTRTILLSAPDGYDFAELPPDGEVKGGAFGSAKATYKQGKDKRSVVIETSVVFDKSIIPVAEYASFRTWLQNTDGLLRQQVRLVKNGAAPKAAVDPAPTPVTAKPSTTQTHKPGDKPKPSDKPKGTEPPKTDKPKGSSTAPPKPGAPKPAH